MQKEDWMFICKIAVGFLGLLFLVVSFDVNYKLNTMQKLGYEVKQVNMDCFAKQNNRWVLCDSAAKNQVQVITEEEK